MTLLGGLHEFVVKFYGPVGSKYVFCLQCISIVSWPAWLIVDLSVIYNKSDLTVNIIIYVIIDNCHGVIMHFCKNIVNIECVDYLYDYLIQVLGFDLLV